MSFPKIFNSNFTNYVKSKEIHDLEKKLISNKCVDEKSFYDTLETKIINGISYKILRKGLNIYRAYNGFFNGDETVDMKDDEFIYYTNKYTAYSFCRFSYVGMCSYEIIEDIYLLDYYNINNLKYLINNIKDENIVDYIKKNIGYGINRFNNKNHPNKFYGSWYYCGTNFIPGLEYVHGVYSIKNVNKLFKYLLRFNIHFEGIINKLLRTFSTNSGYTYYEEYIINVKSIKKIRRNYLDPLDWSNWKFNKIVIPKTGLILRNTLSLKLNFKEKNPLNTNFSVFKYYLNNKCSNKIKFKKNIIFSYNVNNFNNLNINISIYNNIFNILSLINNNSKNIKYLFLQEVHFYNEKIKNKFLNILNKIFNYVYITLNNNLDKKKVYILFATNKTIKKHIIYFDYDDISYKKNNYKIKSNSFLINDGKLLGCFVNLPIREFQHSDKKINNKENLTYIKTRLDIIYNILDKYNVDYICGNFGFTPNEKEVLYLKNKGFKLITNYKNTSINSYMGICMVFLNIKSNMNIKSIDVIKCNYSDHLPIAIEL